MALFSSHTYPTFKMKGICTISLLLVAFAALLIQGEAAGRKTRALTASDLERATELYSVRLSTSDENMYVLHFK